MDYAALLEKYMDYVGLCEGVDFVDDIEGSGGIIKFTQEEVQALKAISERLSAKPPQS